MEVKKIIYALSICGLLTACGSDSSNDNPTVTPPTSNTKIGVLTDGPVSGVSYSINGITKQTNAQGEFEYLEGDTVRFSLGQVLLGEVIASERITPLELADNEQSRLNLLIFLQSLDQNNDHSDGIQISETVINTLNNTQVDFSSSTTDFSSALQNTLDQIPGFEQRTVVDSNQAQDNFKQAFFKDIAGTWTFSRTEIDDQSEIVLNIQENGHYMMGESIPNESDNEGNGIEVGVLDWNPLTGELSATSSIDTNSDWGLTDPNSSQNLIFNINYDGKNLKIGEKENPDEFAFFSRVTSTPNQLQGAWKNTSGSQIFAFFPNNTYYLLDPTGDLSDEDYESCGGPGIEYGTYELINDSFKVKSIIIDTNGCAGISDFLNINLPVSLQSNTVTFTIPNEEPFSLNRIQ